MIANNDIVPAVMFHSVGSEKDDWLFSYISEPLKLFRKKLELLKRKNYNFVFWEDLYQHMAGAKRLPQNSIMLTFDDGYLDNWVYVFPILQQLEAKATIFVNPEFVDPSETVRPQFTETDDSNMPEHGIAHLGFLNWSEMKAMEDSGLVDIQSHSLTHTWYFSSERLVDFVRLGEKRYPWLAWNSYPQKKPFYLIEDYSTLIPTGTPVYEHDKALICRRYLPSPAISEQMVEYVKNKGEMAFKSSNWRVDFSRKHDELVEKYKTDSRYETEDEYYSRIFSELKTSRKVIEDKLSKTVEYICWPGGGYNEVVLNAAKKAGYKAWTLSSRDLSEYRNRFSAIPSKIKRIHSFVRYRSKKDITLGYAIPYYFYSAIKTHKGSLFFRMINILLRYYGRVEYTFHRSR